MQRILLLAGALLCTGFYLYLWFAAQAPRPGTLEWIRRRPPEVMPLLQIHKLRWFDALWLMGAALLGAGLYLTAMYAVDAGMTAALLRGGAAVRELALPALTCSAAYLAVTVLTGSRLSAVFSALFSAVAGLLFPCPEVFVLVLLLALYGALPGAVSWLCLVLASALSALVSLWQYNALLWLLPVYAAVLLLEMLGLRRRRHGPWHMILALLTPALTAATVLTGLLLTGLLDGVQILWQPMFALGMTVLTVWPLLLSGAVLLFSGACRWKDPAAMLLLTVFLSLLASCPLMQVHALTPVAVLVMGYLLAALKKRGYPAAACIAGLVPTVLTGLVTILLFMEV